jgi:DNA-binding IclR family transcriptional regulator
MSTPPNQSALKVFRVLDVLFLNFAQGFTPSELAKLCEMAAPDITRHIKTLTEAGYAEVIPETARIRVSVAMARKAMSVLASLDDAQDRLAAMKLRLTQPSKGD